MFPHPDTVCALKEMDRRALLAEVAEARRAAQAARRPSAGRPALAATMRRDLGSAMVAIGRRLQGAEPVGLAGTASAGSGAAS